MDSEHQITVEKDMSFDDCFEDNLTLLKMKRFTSNKVKQVLKILSPAY